MQPNDIIMWAVCVGVAWLIFASITGADVWLKSLFGKGKESDLERRVELLEQRLASLLRRLELPADAAKPVAPADRPHDDRFRAQ
jgi:sensor domain CHASE-containing protein